MPNLQLWDLFQGTQEWVQNSHGKQAISVWAIEVLLYILLLIYICRNPTCARYPEKEKVARVDPVIARNLEQCYKPNCEAKATQM